MKDAFSGADTFKLAIIALKLSKLASIFSTIIAPHVLGLIHFKIDGAKLILDSSKSKKPHITKNPVSLETGFFKRKATTYSPT